MKLNKLSQTTKTTKKRVGRGYGSGKGGHTAGRGQKGQKSRSKVGLLFEGTKMRKSLIRRLPMQRGKGKFKSFKSKPIILNVKYLNLLKSGTKVDVEVLIKEGLVAKEALTLGMKILGDGVLEKKLTVVLPVSQGAKKKIEKAGGKVINAKDAKKREAKKPKIRKQIKKSQKSSKTKETRTTRKKPTTKTKIKRGSPALTQTRRGRQKKTK